MSGAILSKKDRLEISKLLKEKGLLPTGVTKLEIGVSPEGVVGNVNINLMFMAQKEVK